MPHSRTMERGTILVHGGPGSGRYPEGSGDRPYQHEKWYQDAKKSMYKNLSKGDVEKATKIQDFLAKYETSYEKAYKDAVENKNYGAKDRLDEEGKKASSDMLRAEQAEISMKQNKAATDAANDIAKSISQISSVATKRENADKTNMAISIQEKSISKMTDEELKSRTNRLNLESNYKAAITKNSPNYVNGKVTATEMFQTVGSFIAIGTAVASLASIGKEYLK